MHVDNLLECPPATGSASDRQESWFDANVSGVLAKLASAVSTGPVDGSASGAIALVCCTRSLFPGSYLSPALVLLPR